MFGKLLTNQKIAHKIVKPYVYKALREGLKLMTTVKYKISEGSIPSLSASPGCQNVPKCSKPTFWAFFLSKPVCQNAPKCPLFGLLSGLLF